jgi:phosphatidylglycerophosphate synthase
MPRLSTIAKAQRQKENHNFTRNKPMHAIDLSNKLFLIFHGYTYQYLQTDYIVSLPFTYPLMSKLSAEDKFLDFSDYGRHLAKYIALLLKNTAATPVHVTLSFVACGFAAIYCLFQHQYIAAAILLILKCVLDAADGELARIKNTPSYTGRYLDSVSDIILNFLFLLTIGHLTNTGLGLTFLAFVCVQLQGTLYNYYYVVLRSISAGADTTSKVFENQAPVAIGGESQTAVNILFMAYTVFYGIFDKVIHMLDNTAHKSTHFPSAFMSFVSIYGLGFQLLYCYKSTGLHHSYPHWYQRFFTYNDSHT